MDSKTDWPVVERPRMTSEEFLALPDDGIHRELIQGEVREFGMTYRNRFHSRVEVLFTVALENWLARQAEPRGEVVCGEAGFRLKGTKESIVGIDVALVGPELAAVFDPEHSLFQGPPILAVEILSPSDTQDDLAAMVATYLEVGTVLWVANPDFKTVTIFRPGDEPVTLNRHQTIAGQDYLPGFEAPVASLFPAADVPRRPRRKSEG